MEHVWYQWEKTRPFAKNLHTKSTEKNKATSIKKKKKNDNWEKLLYNLYQSRKKNTTLTAKCESENNIQTDKKEKNLKISNSRQMRLIVSIIIHEWLAEALK